MGGEIGGELGDYLGPKGVKMDITLEEKTIIILETALSRWRRRRLYKLLEGCNRCEIRDYIQGGEDYTRIGD